MVRETTTQPPTDLQIRCPKLGSPIRFAYCRTENQGIPCPRTIGCWCTYFLVEKYLKENLTPEEWQKAFETSMKPKMLSLSELIDQARKMTKK